MKINICFGDSNEYLNNYINTNIFESNNFKQCHPENIDSIADDGEAEQILAINVLNYIDYNKINNVLNNWFNKLKYDGTIIISFFDFLETARLFSLGELHIDDARKIFYGEQKEGWDFFKSGVSLEEIKSFFKNIKCKIEYCKRDGLISLIQIRRIK